MATYEKEQDVESHIKDDPRARETLKDVFRNTARWDSDFPGFMADIKINMSGVEQTGTLKLKNAKEIELSIQNEKARKFAMENLGSIAMHRGPRNFEESDGKYKLQFGDEGIHPLGRSLVLGGDGMSSFYRVKDGRIRQINRKTPRMAFTINIEESVKTQDDKYLTSKYSVYYFNPEGGIKDVESYTDQYTRVGKFDLPEERRIINCENGTVEVNLLTLSNHKLLNR